MGWAYCGEDDYGREIGYGIQATCDKRGCDTAIDRGMGYACGGEHGSDRGCDMYFCGEHNYMLNSNDRCRHRQKKPYGRTLCHSMKRRDDSVYCACHGDHPVEWVEEEELCSVS